MMFIAKLTDNLSKKMEPMLPIQSQATVFRTSLSLLHSTCSNDPFNNTCQNARPWLIVKDVGESKTYG